MCTSSMSPTDTAQVKEFVGEPWGTLALDAKISLKALTEPKTLGGKTIPSDALQKALAVVILNTYKGGLAVTAGGGKGLMMKKLPDGRWSAPAIIVVSDFGVGAVWGATQTDLLIALYSDEAINTFTSKGQLKLGVDLPVVAGPFGKELSADVNVGPGATGALSWSHSTGAMIGVAVGAGELAVSDTQHKKYYGQPVTVEQLFSGEVLPPTDADCVELYQLLEKAAQA